MTMNFKWDVDSDNIREFSNLLGFRQLSQDDVSLISPDLLEMEIVHWTMTGKAPERVALSHGVAFDFDGNTALDEGGPIATRATRVKNYIDTVVAEEVNDENGIILTRVTTVRDYIESVLGLNIPDPPSTAPEPS
ncbi:hypothetical protein AA14337_2932 [Acetobacter malorum DSM 14337]|uniref:Phage protein n=1 Tax=Acetobacter malorum DSM 14337 TaxID=1307910 RepID=A0ABQ0PYM4_9PROT|nr:hypothetical protein [Acetobacter malorum]KXV06766.1 hypothetical protein AD930_06610 [Acetobacter malorum]GBQ84856.1 hypothetical protein AA14337_2932 [Acetobacter malorum DSM 14337]